MKLHLSDINLIFLDASDTEIIQYLKDLYIQPSLEWILNNNGQLLVCHDCSNRIRVFCSLSFFFASSHAFSLLLIFSFF